MKRFVLMLLCIVLVLSTVLQGCHSKEEGGRRDVHSLMEGIMPLEGRDVAPMGQEETEGLFDFSLRLFQKSFSGEKNTLISPLSLLYALAMTANGAGGDTLAQMEEVLGMDVHSLNGFLRSYREALPQGEKYRLSVANSLWFQKDAGLQVKKEFLQTNGYYYGGDIYEAPFNEGALEAINAWVADKTHGMISSILDKIPEDGVMYLLNALAFEAEWAEPYFEHQVSEGVFLAEQGESQEADFMHSEEGLYVELPKATGFIKPYADGKYAFAALLPKEGVSIEELIENLQGQALYRALCSPKKTTVFASLPKFESVYSVEMSDVLSVMGMPDAFDSLKADFSGIGTAEGKALSLGRVLHKSFISVGEQGTKAGAASLVEMLATGAFIQEWETVVLDRPFLYMIIECQSRLPVFIGTQLEMD